MKDIAQAFFNGYGMVAIAMIIIACLKYSAIKRVLESKHSSRLGNNRMYKETSTVPANDPKNRYSNIGLTAVLFALLGVLLFSVLPGSDKPLSTGDAASLLGFLMLFITGSVLFFRD